MRHSHGRDNANAMEPKEALSTAAKIARGWNR
jgi:hypothetical protein